MLTKISVIKIIHMYEKNAYWMYRNDSKFLDIYFRANSADPDQTASRGAVFFFFFFLSFFCLFFFCVFFIKLLRRMTDNKERRR